MTKQLSCIKSPDFTLKKNHLINYETPVRLRDVMVFFIDLFCVLQPYLILKQQVKE
jgi:hypothetical protein